jgi:MFS family permease
VARLPRAVYILQAGLLVTAFGNGAANPFLLLYLHDVRGIPLGLAGLVAATNACTALVTALVAGSLADRRGAVGTMAAGLAFSSTAFVLFPLVDVAWQAFCPRRARWHRRRNLADSPAERRRSRDAARGPPPAFAQQRVVANVGLGLGGLIGGLIVTVSEPETFTTLFLLDAVTFLVYGAVLLVGVRVPRTAPVPHAPRSGYRAVARDRAFVRLAALNFLFVAAVVSLLNSAFPVFARNEAGLSEDAIGALFLLNSATIIVFQLPTARAVEGHRRTRGLALMGLLFALCWSFVLAGALTGPALLLVAAGIVAMSFGECLYDSIQGPLVADLAPPAVLSRYMAVAGFSWQLGFIVGPAAAGLILGAEPYALWPLMSTLCVAGAVYALVLEPALPPGVRVRHGAERLTAKLVQAVEQRFRASEQLFVAADEPEPADQRVEPGRLGRVVAAIVDVGLVDDGGDLPEHGIRELVTAQHRLERAVAVVVAQLDPAHVERDRVRRHVLRIRDEDEARLGIHEASDQPGARRAVDVAARPCRPPHRSASVRCASASTARSARARSGGEK